MTALRLVSITHPVLGSVGTKRLDLLPDAEVTILTPHQSVATAGVAGRVRRISMPTSGRDRRARFPSLATALDLLDPDVIHLHADPDTNLALQVATLCGRMNGRGLVLETEMSATGAASGWAASLRARRTLSRTDAVVTRTASALASLRRLGFTGPGLIAGRGLEPQRLPDTDCARRMLHIMPGPEPVIGWAGPLDTRSHITDLLEAVALCARDVVVVIPASGPTYQEVLDRADALEILHRVRFAAPERAGGVFAERADLSAFPTVLAAVDALLIAPPEHALDRAFCLRTAELAHTHAIPVIHHGLPEMTEMVGEGGWQVPFGDPALLARLFDELHSRPRLLQLATSEAAASALARHSPAAAATELARAITAASFAPMADAPHPDAPPARRRLTPSLRGQTGGT